MRVRLSHGPVHFVYAECDESGEDYMTSSYVAKPLLGREGAAIRVVAGGEEFEQPGDYGREGYVYQEFAPLPAFPGSDGGGRAVLGSWLVDGEPAGLGIRESDGLVTDTYARFVPHVIDG